MLKGFAYFVVWEIIRPLLIILQVIIDHKVVQALSGMITAQGIYLWKRRMYYHRVSGSLEAAGLSVIMIILLCYLTGVCRGKF